MVAKSSGAKKAKLQLALFVTKTNRKVIRLIRLIKGFVIIKFLIHDYRWEGKIHGMLFMEYGCA